ncbi:T9SS type A sorting domain-containing protein [Pedobacter sp. SL55]|uniref:T9SS type A sorting domain-containing protein n=1 Tax=Pedobacter sp. SL55 TaxID=2995161 RepID=UPI00226EBBEB|nr:T9SS type A sorting domain-containing protein [Pedobacter sp. SL55]WAC41148.1 T9SS type A sorting domain-containing protein [Pedobacter sp. SL55]
MKKLLLSLLLVIGIAATGFGQIFSQNFTSSSTLASYISATPNNGQFNNIGTSNANSTVSIVSDALQFTHINSTAGTASFSRTTDFSGPPTFLAIKFRLSVSGTSVAQQTVASFATGSGFGTGNGVESNSSIHSRFGVNLTATDGTFALRDLTTALNSVNLVGPQDISFFVNNTGGSKMYIAPDGSSDAIADDTWELWAGTNKLFDGRASETPAQTLTDMKFVVSWTTANNGVSINVTNIVINDQTTALPVELTTFTAKANLQNVDLAWATASERNNSHFEILRSGDGKTFTKIGQVKGTGTTDIAQNYAFIDKDALPGVNYYQLNQIDYNGNPTLSKIEAVKSNVAATNFKVVANKQDGNIKLTIFAANEGKATLKIYDLNGRKITEQELSLSKGYANLSVPISGASGLHIASLTTATETITQKFIQ